MQKVNIVLIEPQISQNTGNIARTCAATGASLHIIKPMGFEIDDKKLKRAGLDYWYLLDITYYKNINEFYEKNSGEFYYFTTKAKKTHSDAVYGENVYLFFGREDAGISEQILYDNYDKCVRIPMIDEARSLNLSNSVAIAVYEAMRQQGYSGLQTEGALRGEYVVK